MLSKPVGEAVKPMLSLLCPPLGWDEHGAGPAQVVWPGSSHQELTPVRPVWAQPHIAGRRHLAVNPTVHTTVCLRTLPSTVGPESSHGGTVTARVQRSDEVFSSEGCAL